MSLPDTFSYHFYPVGQGLFSAGSIRRHGEGKSRFLWVYDCGSSTSQSLIDIGINRLGHFAGDRKRIDLLILSHFDRDHISGVVRLLRNFKIGTLLLPYMPLAQRIIVAFEEDSCGADDPMIDFYLNPVAFLVGQGGPGIDRILFVPPSGNDGPPYPGVLANPREPGPGDESGIDFDRDKPKFEDDAGSLVQAGHQSHTAVEFLQMGSRITLSAALWEFIPYNDDPQEVISDDFIRTVDEECARLLAASDITSRNVSLERLKKTYDRHFGAGSSERNIISLFLYSGPIYSSWQRRGCLLIEGKSSACNQALPWCRWLFPDMQLWAIQKSHDELLRHQCSILYSGDGYLDTNDRLQKLIKYLDEHRVRRIGVFQVMHHGAESNWHKGVAAAISPLFSIFSSNPERKKWMHPHAPVLRDFWRYGAVQVDQNADFTATGALLE